MINIQTGQWVGRMGGLGAGIDSYYEYLLKVCTQGMWCGGLGVCVHRVCGMEGVCTQGMWCGGCVCVHRVCGVEG